MKTYPLIRIKWSNEHIMAAVFFVLILYLIPQWIQAPGSIISFMAVLSTGLIVDVTANAIRYKRPVCAVSAAVTAAVLYVLTPGIPLWGKLAGVIAALIIGKHIWGGTGKNVFNPAMIGVIFIYLFFNTVNFPFTPTFLLIPAIVLSLPFIIFRPFAAIGLMTGMLASLLINSESTVAGIVSYGVVFWGCLVITDPVTVTPHPAIGATAGFLAGFIPPYFAGNTSGIVFAVLSVNLLSYITDGLIKEYNIINLLPFRIKRIIPYMKEKTVVTDLVKSDIDEKDYEQTSGTIDLSSSADLPAIKILKRIKDNEVFGQGGAAFPTFRKINAVIESDMPKKYLIINGAECDPGLIHDRWILYRYPGEICRGIELLCKCIDFDSVTIAVKDTDGLDFPRSIKIRKIPDYYPVGAEKILIKEVLNKTVSYDQIPAYEGFLIINVQTIFSIYEAVCLNKKAESRFLTVADMVKRTGQVVRVKLGVKIYDVVKTIYPQPGCIFKGGGMMQARIADDGDVVDKTVNFLAVGDFPNYKESPLCSKCGLCSMNCPSGLNANQLVEAIDQGNISDATKQQAQKCINCGTCSYVCLAGRNLSARIKTIK